MKRWLGLGCALGLLMGVQARGQAPEYQMVQVQDLLDSPHRYWARPVLFVDRMVSPPGRRSTEFNRVRYHAFTTERLGTVYAHESIVEDMASVKPDTAMMFLGSVQERSGRFRRTEYTYVVTAYTTRIDEGETLQALVTRMANPDLRPRDPTLQAIARLVEGAQSGVFRYAAENRIDPKELFREGSEHEAAAAALARQAVRGMETATNVTSQEVLAQLVKLIVSTRYHAEASGSVYRAADHLPAPRPAVDPMLEELIRSPDAVPVPEDLVPDDDVPLPGPPIEEDALPVEEVPTSEIDEPAPRRRGFFSRLFGRRDRPEAEPEAEEDAEPEGEPPADEPEAEEPVPEAELADPEEPEPAPRRRGLFRRRERPADDPETGDEASEDPAS